MLILLSASKKKLGSFVTPTTSTTSVNVYSTDSSAFKYGNYTLTVFPSFKKDGGAFVGPSNDVSSIFLASTPASAFTFQSIASSSALVSYKDAGALYYSGTFAKTFQVLPKASGLFIPSLWNNKSFNVSFLPTKMFLRSLQASGSFVSISNGQNDTTNVMYSPYSTSTYNQTLSIQPESF